MPPKPRTVKVRPPGAFDKAEVWASFEFSDGRDTPEDFPHDAIRWVPCAKPSRARKVEVREIGSVHEVLKACGGVTRKTLLRWRATQEFPRPFKTVGRRTELWDLAEVRAWLEARPERET